MPSAAPTSDDRQVRVLSAATALPGPPVDNAALARRFGMSPSWQEWVDVFIGTRTRHLSIDLETDEPLCTLADLGESAGRQALEAAGLDPGAVDLLVLGTATPDLLMPTTASVVADRLGIDDLPVFQLQSGCTGALQAMSVAAQLLRAGDHRTALVIGGDVCARAFDLTADLRTMPPEEMINAVLFGDGAGAVVLTTLPVPGAVTLRRVRTRLVGLGREPGQTLAWFGPNERDRGLPSVTEDYKAIERLVPEMAVEVYGELLADLGWEADELDYLLPPQLSTRMTGTIMTALGGGGRAREISCVTRSGNNGNGLPFLQLEEVLPLMAPGERALGIAIESSKWIKSGFALERE
ncbi:MULTISPECIES: 3-oxoacyl-ACP synthase III family protein [Streptomyces]|uniref:3-oxoacyl-ACP synthase n=1 Tax=Streptomyces tsukubensis (strain DSM 42081 / NBRC 108919 / NRRL 18488 / 9993) TaxID=1114943 RepID=I2MTL1_STRT9|nr:MULTISPECIES: 3-oxoacyl-ACP synthase III family protein [Streptomyces]AZK92683.1 3-oxoacyl-ACP synthase [Streptomyces tsukubensis]EIF88108.1 3-oxoacyl-[acyl-carrier-protein] synthase III [Streptomyces tsukubensis NRRL18488]MYS63602.1 3-oxoacyl-ACP synthase [Streptomyces sp. SID5473]QKM71147.1 3-oxoacyl-ACP synthase [Streptomyces tsukubensis NRRL18488]TAI40667.1 3-oxoacyl-ACP synthase III family protein [Streptomyces tsukubensis]